MTEDDVGDLRVLFLHDAVKLLHILDEVLGSVVSSEVSEDTVFLNALSMSHVIFAADDVSLIGEILCQIAVAAHVFTHAVDDLHDALRRSGRSQSKVGESGFSV